MNFIFRNISWLENDQIRRGDVRIVRGRIREVGDSLAPGKNDVEIFLPGHFLYPGLINAHDHLEMNLYPRLGSPPYENYMAWGNDIYKPSESPIKEIERVPIKNRLMWGGVKNLLSGATTVIHHNPRKLILSSRHYPVKVPRSAWAHSLGFGHDIEKRFPKNEATPFAIHAAEGIDLSARKEIATLHKLGLLKSNTVLIHAVGATDADISLIRQAGASVVWCPSSNNFLFNRTAPIGKMLPDIRVAIGSDSTLTGPAFLLDEMRMAHKTGQATPSQIFAMVTREPARIFNLPIPAIAPGAVADLWIAPRLHDDYFESLLLTHPENIVLVMIDGSVSLADQAIMKLAPRSHFPFQIDGQTKYLRFDLRSLQARIQKKTGPGPIDANPLWRKLATP
jgi:cytosine/adenosine deaminase-related metal-dependent hydrolase